MDPDLLAAAVLILVDMGDAAGRFARDCDRLASILRSLLPDPPPGKPVEINIAERRKAS